MRSAARFGEAQDDPIGIGMIELRQCEREFLILHGESTIEGDNRRFEGTGSYIWYLLSAEMHRPAVLRGKQTPDILQHDLCVTRRIVLVFAQQES